MARAERSPDRLSTPGRRRRSTLPTLRLEPDAFGRFAEGFARFMGTARFLTGMTVVVIVWVLWNVPVGPPRPRFDEYPFIFLTLMLSLQASYAAPLILLAQNRQEARDRVGIEQDRDRAEQSRADMDFLAREVASLRMSVGELATRDYLRSELRAVLADWTPRPPDVRPLSGTALSQPSAPPQAPVLPPVPSTLRDGSAEGTGVS